PISPYTIPIVIIMPNRLNFCILLSCKELLISFFLDFRKPAKVLFRFNLAINSSKKVIYGLQPYQLTV
ncbi:MAG TPA: hypothetical protein PKE52_01380, partial [Bacteroidales bacterium]|nr:hypothetical protein [Bacteroidales bacterium]